MPGRIAPLLGILALMLSGCWAAQPSPAAHATQAARSQATRVALATQAAQAMRAAEPVWLDITAREEGSFADRNGVLIVDMTVTNRTGATISLFGDCQYPSPRVDVNLRGTYFHYVTNLGVGCPIMPLVDIRPLIAPGASHTWTETITYNMLQWDDTMLMGTYLIKAYAGWHQGTLAQVLTDHPTALAGLATAQITFAVH